MENIYYSPEAFGLKTIGMIEWSDGSYQFDMTVVWQRPDGTFAYGEDSGCSCPSPFESTAADDLIAGTIDEIKAHLDRRNAEQGAYSGGDQSADIATLLEAMIKARSVPLPTEKIVDLAELTRRCGEPEHRQHGIAAFADSQGPWTEAEADLIVRVWTNTDSETGVYVDPEQGEQSRG
jgi:hypothetical protein